MLSCKGVTLIVTFGAFVFLVEAPIKISGEGVEIASLYQCAHGLRGLVYALNDRQIFIKGFNYDGKGPAAWFHGQLNGSRGVYTSDPVNYVTLPYPDASCNRLQVGKRYTDEDITLTLPRSIKDFSSIGIYCYEYCHNFGHVVIPHDLNVPAAPSGLATVQECSKPNYAGCQYGSSKNSAFHPDCVAGATTTMPGNGNGAAHFTIVSGWIVISMFSALMNNC